MIKTRAGEPAYLLKRAQMLIVDVLKYACTIRAVNVLNSRRYIHLTRKSTS